MSIRNLPSKFKRKSIILGLSVFVFAALIITVNYPKLKQTGEVAGVVFTDIKKFLAVDLVGAATSNPYTNVNGDVAISGDITVAGRLKLNNSPVHPWGNSIIDGRVWSANNNIHLSPPNGSNVVINTDYRDAGGAAGTAGLTVSGDATVNGETYVGNWVRHSTSAGTYWSATGHHIYVRDANDFYLRSGAPNNIGIAMANNTGGIYGFFYADGSGTGILTNARGWAMRMDNSASAWFNGAVGIYTNPQAINGGGGNLYRLTVNPITPGDGIKLITDGVNSPGLRFESSGNTYYGSLAVVLANNHWISGSTVNEMVLNNAVGNLVFATSGVRRMTIDTGGNVNIINGLYHNGGYHSGWDYAEYIKSSDPSIEAGDLVAADPNNPETIIKSDSINKQSVLGIISTKPGDVGGLLKRDENTFYTKEEMFQAGYRMLALAGRVPVKVSNENGEVKIGDPLTSSSTPGVAMKATKAGTIVGKAVENFNGGQTCTNNPNLQCGKITALLNVSWYDPDVILTSTNGFHLDFGILKDASNNLITRIGTFAEIIVGKIQAGIVETKQLIVNGVDIIARLDAQQKEIDALKLEIENLKK